MPGSNVIKYITRIRAKGITSENFLKNCFLLKKEMIAENLLRAICLRVNDRQFNHCMSSKIKKRPKAFVVLWQEMSSFPIEKEKPPKKNTVRIVKKLTSKNIFSTQKNILSILDFIDILDPPS
jgi:hypothetical protein